MSTPEWITVEAVASYVDAPVDDRMTLATAAVKAAVERRHPALSNDDLLADGNADMRAASIEWAALNWQARNAPSGYAGYGDEGSLFDSLGTRRSDIMRRLRWRIPVVA